jgi:hypothetical protein
MRKVGAQNGFDHTHILSTAQHHQAPLLKHSPRYMRRWEPFFLLQRFNRQLLLITAIETVVLIHNRTATTTALCPTPSASMTCKFSSSRNVDPKYLIASYNNRELDGITREECHQACLQNPECKAFGLTQWRSVSLDIDPRTGCSLYRVPVSQDLYVEPDRRDYIYDRGCPDYLPVSQSTLCYLESNLTTRSLDAHLLIRLKSPTRQ